MNVVQREQPIAVIHVVDSVEREKNEVKTFVVETTQVARICTHQIRVWKFFLRSLNQCRRVIDANIVVADIKQQLRRSASAEADVQQPFFFDLIVKPLEDCS